jgi:tetratricopeptide (TPR) repeat protein
LAIFQKLADANPAVAELQNRLARSHLNIGTLLRHGGKPEEAMAESLKALAIFQKLADANPAVVEFEDGLAYCHIQIGDLLSRTARPQEAMEAYLKALAINQKVSGTNPAVLRCQGEIARAHNRLGRLHAHQQRFAEAFTAFDAGLAIAQKLAQAEPKRTEYTHHLGCSHAWRGWALVRYGHPSQAAADLRRAVEVWAKAAPDSEDRFELARALALLAGLSGEANSGVTKDEAARFADRSIASLRDAFSAGWGWPDELKEPDFEPLRGRDDFKKLLAEVEAKDGVKAKQQH